ncbi:ACP S-malonyltransferase [cf. Phormidesmis sp. LEGE 11477]|uniref:ACP S-malonyltransferase n=1 Tax=cf. Phormidesmis sp. LEGE 11477 TaxID=1828680 RepID=UPI0018807AFA|nr:ACP S-malonyltransferase [cf. Phormidesmis sp. LEGE 11477]MBE9062605.1 ACP S-malonyltransferase [cf. Phormidesmis sp. LEGE 11477]
MICLIDHNLKGHALVFFGAIASQGWLDIVPIQFVTFDELDLPTDSDDRVVWCLAQKNQMVLLTANRSMKGKDSLEQVMREENVAESLPVVTIGNADRLLSDPEYRGRCVESLVEIALSLDSYCGARRVFIPS